MTVLKPRASFKNKGKFKSIQTNKNWMDLPVPDLWWNSKGHSAGWQDTLPEDLRFNKIKVDDTGKREEIKASIGCNSNCGTGETAERNTIIRRPQHRTSVGEQNREGGPTLKGTNGGMRRHFSKEEAPTAEGLWDARPASAECRIKLHPGPNKNCKPDKSHKGHSGQGDGQVLILCTQQSLPKPEAIARKASARAQSPHLHGQWRASDRHGAGCKVTYACPSKAREHCGRGERNI